ncbi:MAG: DUF4410 domain-containing protein [Verrucomicrobia bacterium]|nr:DUF4410 domain-containing protein [Verrucomicrobiota bacterium]
MSNPLHDPSSRTKLRTVGILVTLGGLLLLATSCARTNVQYVGTDARPLPKPERIVVHPFGVSADQVALDQTIGLRLQELVGSKTDDGERLRIARELSGIVAKRLVQDLQGKGFDAVVAPAGTPPGAHTLEIDGQFLSVDQGSQRQRMIIGFGLGASEVRVLVQAFEVTDAGRVLADDFYINTQSSRRPGMGPMAGGGAVAGNAAAALAVSSTTALVGARAQTVEADAQNLADRVAEELQKYFVQQGWTPAR